MALQKSDGSIHRRLCFRHIADIGLKYVLHMRHNFNFSFRTRQS